MHGLDVLLQLVLRSSSASTGPRALHHRRFRGPRAYWLMAERGTRRRPSRALPNACTTRPRAYLMPGVPVRSSDPPIPTFMLKVGCPRPPNVHAPPSVPGELPGTQARSSRSTVPTPSPRGPVPPGTLNTAGRHLGTETAALDGSAASPVDCDGREPDHVVRRLEERGEEDATAISVWTCWVP
jgi:hypothetical protein